MRYSLSAMALAAATFTQVIAVPSMHNHQHLHSKKEAELLQARDVAIVYVTRTIVWEEPDATPIPTSTPIPPTTTLVTSTTAAPVPVYSSVDAAPAAPKSSSTKSAPAAATNAVESDVILSTSQKSKLLSLGVAAIGENSMTETGGAWIGSTGKYTNKFVNNAGEDISVVIWGSWGSWVNVKVPQITISLAKGESKTVSFAEGAIGAWAGIYSDTKLVNGQISNTWGEYTFNQWGVYDVSMEVNMKGHAMSIVGSQGCTSDMNTCVFVCDSGDVCTTGYSLKNCAAGSQPGAQTGVDTYGNGGASGGCGGFSNGVHLTTTFGA